MRQLRGHAALAAFGALTVWFALVQAITLGTSALGLSLGRVPAVAALLAAVAAAVAFGLWLVAGARPPVAEAPPGKAGDRFARVVVALTVVWAASMWLRLWVLAFRRPPYDWDGLYYHIPALHAWAKLGRVAWIGDVPDVPFVNLPMGVEAHTFFMYRVLGDARLVTAGNLWFWPLAFLALIVIAGAIGARVPFRCLAGALFAGIPVVVCQSVTAYTDPAFTATVMAALAAACVFVTADGLHPTPRALLFGAALGLMAGAKGSGAPFALIVFTATLVWALIANRGRAWPAWLGRLALAGAVAAAIGGYWYVRNALHSGNHIYPIRLAFGAKVLAPGFDHVAFSEANLPDWLARVPAFLRAPVSWLEPDAPIAGYAPVGGLGYLWLIALPAIAWLIWTVVRRGDGDDAARRRGTTVFLAGVLALMFAIQAATWWSRFTIWLHALGLPALALFLQTWHRSAVTDAPASARARLGTLLPAIGLVLVLGVGVAETERTLAIEQRTGRIEDPEGRVRYQTTIERLFPGFAGDPTFGRFADAAVIARSQWGSYGTLLGGVLAMPPGRRTIVVLPPDPTAADIEALRGRGISWILWDERGAGPVPPAIESRVVERRAWRPWPNETFDVLRISDRDELPAH